MIVSPTLVPAIISVVTQITSTMGPMIAKHGPIVLDVIGKNLPRVIQTLDAICTVAQLLNPTEKVEDIGAKAMIADKRPEDFDKINDYINYLRTEIEVDSDTLRQKPEDLIVRQAVGTTVILKALSEQFGILVTPTFMNTISQLDIDTNWAHSIIKSYAQFGLTTCEIVKYLSDSLPLDVTSQHSQALVSAYMNANPSSTLFEAENAVMDLKGF